MGFFCCFTRSRSMKDEAWSPRYNRRMRLSDEDRGWWVDGRDVDRKAIDFIAEVHGRRLRSLDDEDWSPIIYNRKIGLSDEDRGRWDGERDVDRKARFHGRRSRPMDDKDSSPIYNRKIGLTDEDGGWWVVEPDVNQKAADFIAEVHRRRRAA